MDLYMKYNLNLGNCIAIVPIVHFRVPCRYLIALVTKEENLSFNHLPINSRWRIDFFVDNLEPEPILLDSIKQIEEITDKFQVSN